MKTHSRFPQPTFPHRAWRLTLALLAATCGYAQEPAAFPLLKSCGQGSETVTTIRDSDSVQIRYGFSTDSGTCYAVTATVGGQTVDGYLLRAASGRESQHPAIAAFYIVAMLLLCLHLYHGVWSMFQSAGVSHPRYTPWLKRFAAICALSIAIGNISIPVAALAGWLK